MDINALQGSNAYTANQLTPPPVEDSLAKRQNREITDQRQDNTQSSRQAFEVTITQEAQARLAAEKLTISATQDTAPGRRPSAVPGSAQEASQIVNIVA